MHMANLSLQKALEQKPINWFTHNRNLNIQKLNERSHLFDQRFDLFLFQYATKTKVTKKKVITYIKNF